MQYAQQLEGGSEFLGVHLEASLTKFALIFGAYATVARHYQL